MPRGLFLQMLPPARRGPAARRVPPRLLSAIMERTSPPDRGISLCLVWLDRAEGAHGL